MAFADLVRKLLLMFGISAHRRIFAGEIMDSPDIPPGDLLAALAGLRRINRVSFVAEQMAKPILQMARAADLHCLTLLDVACGGGDVPVAIALELQKAGVPTELTLLDQSPTALKAAAASARSAGVPCQTVEGDATKLSECKNFDVVTSSLFLHHLSQESEVAGVLRYMHKSARRMVIVSDLRRSVVGWVAAWIVCRFLSRSYIVHNDGPASVQAAWTISELRDLARRAGMPDAAVHATKPWRMTLVWKSK